MTDPIQGSAEDFLVNVQTELGAEIQSSVLAHVSIDERRLSTEAEQLPQLLFYYSASYQRANQRIEQRKLALKKMESQERVRLIEEFRARGERIAEAEQNARLDLVPTIDQARQELNEMVAKRDIIKGVIDSLVRKGFSLQLVANVRAKEEDWLRQSFFTRLQDSPHQKEIQQHLGAIQSLM